MKRFLFFLLTALAERSQLALNLSKVPKDVPLKEQDNEIRYVGIFDVGSTGTRLYIHGYKYHPTECYGRGAIDLLMPGWSEKTKPGLAVYWQKDRSSSIAEYFKPLLDFANSTLHPEQQRKTILLAKATGGFRHLPSSMQSQIFHQMFEELRKNWSPFKISKGWLKVLSGAEEGAYSWLAVNQLARRFPNGYEQVKLHPWVAEMGNDEDRELPESRDDTDNWFSERNRKGQKPFLSRKQRVGLVEVGGASAQLAVETPTDVRDLLENETSIMERRAKSKILFPISPDSNYFGLNFCRETLYLYVRSFEGYGRQAALEQFLRSKVDLEKRKLDSSSSSHYWTSCLPKGVAIPLAISDEPFLIREKFDETTSFNESDLIIVEGGGEGGVGCREDIKQFLKNANLSSLPFELPSDYRIYATENFYYFNRYVANSPKGDNLFSGEKFWKAASQICDVSSSEAVRELLHSEAAEEKTISACFGLVFLTEFLNHIAHLENSHPLKAVTSVKGLETSFAVGALLLELPPIIQSYQNLQSDSIWDFNSEKKLKVDEL